MSTAQSLIDQITNYFKDKTDIPLVILFGSLAQNDLKAHSDIDLAIAGNHSISSRELIKLSSMLSFEVPRKIDLIDLKTAGGLILQQILQKGRVIKNEDPALRLKFISQMLVEKEDWIPNQEYIRKRHVERYIHGE